MLNRLFRTNNVRRSTYQFIKNNLQKRSSVTKTGWTYESPNLAQYRVLKGSLVSICLRGVFVYNLAMLIIEGVFYPFNVIDFVRGVKRN